MTNIEQKYTQIVSCAASVSTQNTQSTLAK